jgi:hypothetical protein
MEVLYDQSEIELRKRRSSRLNWKYPGSYSRKAPTSKKAKFPIIVKSSSSTENLSWKHSAVQIKVYLKPIKVHEDNDSSKSKNHHVKYPLGVHQIYPTN